jgi:endonuclease YncB( thermonuclease family)
MTPREEAQSQIRAELDRYRPLDVSRRTLELIAEMAVRFSTIDGQPRLQVVDEAGAPRFLERGGERVPMGIPGLVAEIHAKHPALFESPAPGNARKGHTVEASPAPEPRSRDWLMLRDGTPAEPAPEAAAAAPISAERMPALAPQTGGVTARQADPAAPGRAANAVAALGTAGAGLAQAFRAQARTASQGMSQRIGAARDAMHERRAHIADTPLQTAAAQGGPLPRGGNPPSAERTGSRPLSPATPERPRITPYIYGLALFLAGLLLYALWPSGTARAPDRSRPAVAEAPAQPAPEASRAATAAAPPRPEPNVTGGLPPGQADGDRVLKGVPEVVDTVTLRLEGRVVRLFGVEWARGGQPEDLTSYLRDRETECRPVEGSSSYRCTVNGQDLSRVVLFNGGGRTNAEATPELLKAEDHARDGKLGVWKR